MAAMSYKDAVRIIDIINFLTVLRNYTSLKENKSKFLFSWLYHVLFICIFCCLMVYCENNHIQSLPYNIERIVHTFTKIIFMCGFVCIVYLGLQNSENMLKLVKHIDNVDENLKKLGCKIDYRNLYLHVLLIGSLWLINAIVLIAFYTKWSLMENLGWTFIFANVSFVYGMNVNSIALYDFKIGVYWLGLRFKETNELLRTFLVEGQQIKTEDPAENNAGQPNRKPKKESRLDRWLSEYSLHRSRVFPMNNVLKQESQSVKRVHLLQEIRITHLQLCCATKMLNHIFDAQVLTFVAVLLIYITVVLYYVYVEFQRQNHSKPNINFYTVFMVDAIMSCMKIGLVSYSCEYTTNQANKAIEIIHACSVYEIDTDLKDEIIQFSLQISHTQLGRSKSAFFRLNYGFIRDCISFVTTYLVIIIQWSQNWRAEDPLIVSNQTSLNDTRSLKN